ncbi:MAG: DUF2784 domain-containing protein [Jiangellaceae bacterium]
MRGTDEKLVRREEVSLDMAYEVLTTVILSLHFAWLVYLAAGGFLAWRWPWAIWPHVAAAAWGAALVLAGLDCPLTAAEDWSRRQAGGAGVSTGFIDRYVEGVIYPERYTGVLQVLVALVVAVSWAGAHLLARRRRLPYESKRTTAV